MNRLLTSGAIAAALVLPAYASAQDSSGPSVEVRPATIALAPWDTTTEVRVVLLNSGSQPVRDATLTIFSNDVVATTTEPTGPAPELGRGDSFAWKVTLDVGNARRPADVDIDVSFTTADAKRPRHIYKELKLTEASGSVVEKPIEVTLSGSYDTVNESRPGRGYVVVQNNLDVVATITDIRVETPDPQSFGSAIDFDASANTSPKLTPFQVPARSSRSQFVEISASRSVASGKHRIVLAVDAEWRRQGRAEKRTLLIGQDVTLGVFFESELLKALGVPSFLVLPGCLFLFTIQVLLKFKIGGDNRPTQFPTLSSTEAEFWVIAITWSGLFAWAYSIVIGTDYLSRYGAADLRNVWLLSIGIGAVVYAALVGLNKTRNMNRPTRKDDQVTTLAKMGRRKQSFVVPKVEVTVNTTKLTGYLIDDSDAQTKWVAPPIEIVWTTDGAKQKGKKELIDLVDSRNTADVAAALKQAVNGGLATVSWKVANAVQLPTSVAAADITRRDAEESMVSVS